jgi:hypothetical protein
MPINETGHLVLHNVADEELYVGVDGITRPYAVVYPGYVILLVSSIYSRLRILERTCLKHL